MEDILKRLGAAIDWGIIGKSTIRIVFILIAAIILTRVLTSLIRLFREHISHNRTDVEAVKRLETLGRAFRYIITVIVTLVTSMLILSEIGINIAPILGAAGVVGIAAGFGAQSLIKDYFNGLFILLENQVRKGDVIVIANKGGLVEEVTLRYVRLRDYNGDVHFVPSSLIDTVTNKSRDYSYALIDVSVAYREDLDEVMAVMAAVAEEMQQDSVYSGKIIESIEIAGVEEWGNSSLVIRSRIKVHPLEQWDVRRTYLKRLKAAFDARGIEIPYPHLTIYAGQGKDGSAPPFRMRTSEPPASMPNPPLVQKE